MSVRNFNTNITQLERDRIGKLLKELRENEGISQKKLAFEVGISPTRVVEIEKGRADFKIDTLISILKYFRKTIDFIDLI
jgi:DNA-binding XRE family transcriptional regulator